MNLLSKVSYWKIQWLGTKIEIRSTLNTLGLCNNYIAEKKNKMEFFEICRLTKNLNSKERKRMYKYVRKHPV